MGTKREDATSGEYLEAVRSGANTPELVAPILGQPVDRVRRSLNVLFNLKLLDRVGCASDGTFTVRGDL
jgi:hypothetical protein